MSPVYLQSIWLSICLCMFYTSINQSMTFVCLSLCLSICLWEGWCLSICLCICLWVGWYLCMADHLYRNLSICCISTICLSFCLCICLWVGWCLCMTDHVYRNLSMSVVYLPINLSVCLSVYVFVYG